jgi:hypothetical protein
MTDPDYLYEQRRDERHERELRARSIRWTLRIEKACPSQNEFAFSSWRKGHRSKAEWKVLIRGSKDFLSVPRAQGKRRLIIERHAKGILDESNLIGGAKGIIDDLVQLGLLVDDKPEFLELAKPIQARLAAGERRPYTLLILEEVAA